MTKEPFTDDIEAVAAALNSGRIAIVPTDTVYGLAASLDHHGAIRKIYDAKGRPEEKPIPILIDSPASITRFVAERSEAVECLMRAFWPGALTIIFPASELVPAECRSSDGTVGLRLPDHPGLRRLLTACGGALAVTSANRSGEPEHSAPRCAYLDLKEHVDIVLDAGKLVSGPPSTVVDPRQNPPRILRHGAIDDRAIDAAMRSCRD